MPDRNEWPEPMASEGKFLWILFVFFALGLYLICSGALSSLFGG